MRRAALAAREQLTATARAALATRLECHLAGLLEQLQPGLVGFCWPFRGEPDLRHFIADWLAGDPQRTAALPVVTDRAQPMVFRRWVPGSALVPDRFGIPHPPAGPAVLPELVLVPLNAFDAAGYRIGYGGGYFDRTLAASRMTAVGVGFELGRVADTLAQAHDRPMDWIVTEAGAWRASQARNIR